MTKCVAVSHLVVVRGVIPCQLGRFDGFSLASSLMPVMHSVSARTSDQNRRLGRSYELAGMELRAELEVDGGWRWWTFGGVVD